MKRLIRAYLAAACLTAILPGLLPGQNKAIPRSADGKPDLTGVWQAASTRRGTWEEANADGGLGNGPAPPGAPGASAQPRREPAPYQPWAAEKVLESFNRRAIDDPTAYCLPPGVPRVSSVGLFPMQIVQTPRTIVMMYEYLNTFRIIPINTKHPEELEPTFMGDSVGRWEGDTLVVDVTSFNDKTWLTGAGTFHSEELHVVERYTRVDQDTIQYEATMEDPKVLTKPWVFRTTIMRRDGTRLREYVCDENNVDRGRYDELLKNESLFRRK
ncbi:MAG: hypothetical protein C5B51_22410 [Terriglobia bacterium]|nr:MAG: hypothetical protein C5B51_22410 [Terriglobia bacterium]